MSGGIKDEDSHHRGNSSSSSSSMKQDSHGLRMMTLSGGIKEEDTHHHSGRSSSNKQELRGMRMMPLPGGIKDEDVYVHQSNSGQKQESRGMRIVDVLMNNVSNNESDSNRHDTTAFSCFAPRHDANAHMMLPSSRFESGTLPSISSIFNAGIRRDATPGIDSAYSSDRRVSPSVSVQDDDVDMHVRDEEDDGANGKG